MAGTILKAKVTTARSNQSQTDVAQLRPSTNVPTTYQLPTPYSFQDIV